MARLYKLSARQVATLKVKGRYGDGGGLWLQVSPAGTKSWLFRYRRNGRDRQMGLGSLDTVSLASARQRAQRSRELLLDGVDPIDLRRAERQQAQLEAARCMCFQECAEAFIAAHGPGWRNPVHRAQWRSTLSTYVFPVVGRMPVADIDTGLVLKCLEPIWTEKPETASRVRGRIERVLDWARARGYRQGENPARWRGHLDQLLPARRAVAAVRHHAAMTYDDVPAFMDALRAEGGVAARALEFLILTAARTGEVVGATSEEIHREKAVWIVPDTRMKAGREHRVPLVPRALEILDLLPTHERNPYLFIGMKPRHHISTAAMSRLLDRMGCSAVTVHGFRSTFRDWCAEMTAFSQEVAEMALAHAISNKVEAAYRRGDLFAKRRRLMEEWARWCARPAGTAQVIKIRG